MARFNKFRKHNDVVIIAGYDVTFYTILNYVQHRLITECIGTHKKINSHFMMMTRTGEEEGV